MLVLIPNPNQTVELVKLQKAFIAEHKGFYQHTPLWIFFKDDNFSKRDFNKDDLKKFSAGITKVELDQPEVYFSDSLQRVVLGSGVSISTTSDVCKAELVICGSVSSQGGSTMEVKQTPASEGSGVHFPFQLKIFRLAAAEQLAPGTYAVNESVWRKIK